MGFTRCPQLIFSRRCRVWLLILLGTTVAFTLFGNVFLTKDYIRRSWNKLTIVHVHSLLGLPDSYDLCKPLPATFAYDLSFVPCNWRSTTFRPNCTKRMRAYVRCSKRNLQQSFDSADIVQETVSVNTPPANYSFNDECLKEVVRQRCSEDGLVIPRVIHFITFGGRNLSFHAFLTVLSTVRFVQPCLVLFHTDKLPAGPYWDALLRLVAQIVHVPREAPTSIFGNIVKVVEHQADIARLEAVNQFGGLYVDTDYFLLNSVDELRKYDFVIGIEVPNQNFGNGVFMAKAGAEFLNVWHNSYRTFNDSVWGEHSLFLPFRLHKEKPEIPCHVVETFLKPFFAGIKEKFYDNSTFSWSDIHGIHTYVRLFPGYFEGEFERKNDTVGRIARLILFGNTEKCYSDMINLHDVPTAGT